MDNKVFLKDYFYYILREFNKLENNNEYNIFEEILDMDSLNKKITLLKLKISINNQNSLDFLLKESDIINKQYFKRILKESLKINEFKKLYNIYKTKFIYHLLLEKK